MQVNAAAPFWLAQAAIPHLLATEGNIVNVLSQSALMGTPYLVPYSMFKAALLARRQPVAQRISASPHAAFRVGRGDSLLALALPPLSLHARSL